MKREPQGEPLFFPGLGWAVWLALGGTNGRLQRERTWRGILPKQEKSCGHGIFTHGPRRHHTCEIHRCASTGRGPKGRQTTRPTETWMADRRCPQLKASRLTMSRQTPQKPQSQNESGPDESSQVEPPKASESCNDKPPDATNAPNNKRVGNRQAIPSRAPKAPKASESCNDKPPKLLSLALSVTTGSRVTSRRASPPIEKGAPCHGGRRRRRPYSLNQYLSHRFAKK